jgi:ACS family glucarate transporter-like MFS transporter
VFTALTAVVVDTPLASWFGVVGALAIVRLLIGVGEAVAPPNGARTIANWMAPGERGLAFGITFSGNTIGAAIAPPLVVWIMITFGWREAFYISGAAGIFVALFWYWIATDRPAGHRWVNRAELEHIDAEAVGEGAGSSLLPAGSGRLALFRTRELWCVTGAYFAVGYILYLYFAWFYLYLVKARGLSVEAAGFYTMAPFVVSAVCAPLGGRLTDVLARRYGKAAGRAILGIFGLVFTGFAVVAGAAVENVSIAVILLSLGAGATYASMAAYWATCLDISSENAGMASGFMNMGCNFGGVLSPVLTPLIAEAYGWHAALYVAGAVAACGALFWIGLLPRARPALARPA